VRPASSADIEARDRDCERKHAAELKPMRSQPAQILTKILAPFAADEFWRSRGRFVLPGRLPVAEAAIPVVVHERPIPFARG
jgi:hypothetical protein